MSRICCLSATFVVIFSSTAHAEKGELTSSVEGAVSLPSFDSGSPTAFDLAAWTLGGGFDYGVIHNLHLGLRFSYSRFNGVAPRYATDVNGRLQEGQLSFAGQFFHPQATARVNLFPGYNLAPYLDLGVGFLWAIYRGNQLLDDQFRLITEDIEDFGEGSLTLEAGFSLNYRIYNRVTVGIGVRWMTVFNTIYSYSINVPFKFAYYWF